jgi:hypothetical protein
MQSARSSSDTAVGTRARHAAPDRRRDHGRERLREQLAGDNAPGGGLHGQRVRCGYRVGRIVEHRLRVEPREAPFEGAVLESETGFAALA